MLGSRIVPTVSAAVFSVEFDLLHEILGPQAAIEVVKALGDYTNRQFSPIGAFSARQSRDQIVTIFPHTNIDEAEQMVGAFGEELERAAIANLRNLAGRELGIDHCFEVHVRAGVTEVLPSDEIDQIIEKATSKQRVVATHRCEIGGNA
jgi:hypothetical protein